MVTFLFYFSSLPITSPVAPSPLRNPLECICSLSFDVYASLQTKNHVSLNLYNGIVLQISSISFSFNICLFGCSGS